MTKVKNKKTNVIKEINSETLVGMYLETGEWEIVKSIEKKEEKAKEEKPINSFKINK